MRMSSAQFAAFELHMYLDTHPNDADAIAKMRKYNEIFNQLKREFESKYGPITSQDAYGDKRWEWIQNPWPWESEAN